MWAAVAAALAAVFPVHAPGAKPVAYGGPSGRIAVTGWRYRPDPDDRGRAAGWARGHFGGARVRVPDVGNPSGTRPGTSAAYKGSIGWYTAALSSTGGDYALHFDAASSRADVWIDGRHLGSHDGAYDPFDFETRLARGGHRLVVRVDWRSPAAQSARGFHRTWFNYGGLNGEVTIRHLRSSAVTGASLDTTLEQPDGRGGASAAVLQIAARVQNRGRARRLHVAGRLRRGARTIRFATHSMVIGHNRSATLTTRVRVPHPVLWKPGDGRRYELDLAVPAESGFRGRVGLRTLRIANGKLLVNDVPTVLRGASLHEDTPANGDAPTSSDMDAAIRRLRRIGANATRVQHPLSPAFLEHLDAAGILVWEQIGPVDSPGQWLARTPALRAVARGRARRALRAARLHPSLAVWGLGIEVADNGRPGQGRWIDSMARELHAADPGRLVGVDVWGPHRPERPARLYSHLDAIGFTSYFGWYEDTLASAARVATDLRARLRKFTMTFPGRLVLLSEFGAEGTPSAQNAYAKRGGRGYQAALLGTELAALHGQPVGGALVWVLDDFAINPAFHGGSVTKADPAIRLTAGLNQKGLFDRRGQAKPAAAVVRTGLAALGG